jgi:hypothetical protein
MAAVALVTSTTILDFDKTHRIRIQHKNRRGYQDQRTGEQFGPIGHIDILAFFTMVSDKESGTMYEKDSTIRKNEE